MWPTLRHRSCIARSAVTAGPIATPPVGTARRTRPAQQPPAITVVVAIIEPELSAGTPEEPRSASPRTITPTPTIYAVTSATAITTAGTIAAALPAGCRAWLASATPVQPRTVAASTALDTITSAGAISATLPADC